MTPITGFELREQAVHRALEILYDIMEDDGVTSTEARLEAARIILVYDAEVYSTNADLMAFSDSGDDDEEEDDGER